jgi:hypothetical protein
MSSAMTHAFCNIYLFTHLYNVYIVSNDFDTGTCTSTTLANTVLVHSVLRYYGTQTSINYRSTIIGTIIILSLEQVSGTVLTLSTTIWLSVLLLYSFTDTSSMAQVPVNVEIIQSTSNSTSDNYSSTFTMVVVRYIR